MATPVNLSKLLDSSLSGADTAGLTSFWRQMFPHGASTRHPTRDFWTHRRDRAFPAVFSCWPCSTVRLRPGSTEDKSYKPWPARVISASSTTNPATAPAGTGSCLTEAQQRKGSGPLGQDSGWQPAAEDEHAEAVNHSDSKWTHLAEGTGTGPSTKGGRDRCWIQSWDFTRVYHSPLSLHSPLTGHTGLYKN